MSGSAAQGDDIERLQSRTGQLEAAGATALWARALDLVHVDLLAVSKAELPAESLWSHARSPLLGDLAPLLQKALARRGIESAESGWTQRRRERFTLAVLESGLSVIPWPLPPGPVQPLALPVSRAQIESYLAGPRWPDHSAVLSLVMPDGASSGLDAWERLPIARGDRAAIGFAEFADRWVGFVADPRFTMTFTRSEIERAFPGFPGGWQRLR